MAPRKKAKATDGEPLVDVRGQMTLPLGDEQYVLRPSYEAILAIERELRPLFELARAGVMGALSLDEMSVISVEMMKAYGRTLFDSDPLASVYRAASTERIGKLIYEAGGPRICARLGVVLTGAVNGGYTAEGEAKAGTAQMTALIPAEG